MRTRTIWRHEAARWILTRPAVALVEYGAGLGAARPEARELWYHCVHIKVKTMQATKVGIREFRENLSSFLESKTPIAITRHGATIGIYLPTRRKPSQAELDALRAAGEKLDAMIAAAGTGEEE